MTQEQGRKREEIWSRGVKKHQEIDLLLVIPGVAHPFILNGKEEKCHQLLTILMTNTPSAELHESVEHKIKPKALAFIIRELEKCGVIKLLIYIPMDQRD